MTHNGYARSIRPVHTSADGDRSTPFPSEPLLQTAIWSARLQPDVMSEAILCAVRSAKSAYGYPALRDLNF